MNNSKNTLILVVDDDRVTLQLTKRMLSEGGYQRKRILVIEDDLVTSALLARLLESEGYTPTMTRDRIDALLRMEENEYDLVLSDVDMPNLDGF